MTTRKFIRQWLRNATCLAMVLPMTGCTYALWTPAFETHADRPQIAGLMRNYPKPGDRGLVITYQAPGDGTDVDLFIPLNAEGYPVKPFRPIGTAYLVNYSDRGYGESIAGKLGTEQMSAILALATTPAKERGALQKHFNAADWSPSGATAIYRPILTPEQRGTVWLLAYKTDLSGRIVPVSLEPANSSADKITLPHNVHLVLVPGSVERPPGDQARNQAVAVVLTPVSIAADAAGTGVVLGIVAVVLPIAIPIALIQQGSNKPSRSASQKQPDQPQPAAIPVCPPDDAPGSDGVARATGKADTVLVVLSAHRK